MLKWEARLIQRISDLGENMIVGKVYVLILKHGPITCDDIAKMINLESEAVQKAVERLISLPLVTVDLDRKHRTVYHALPPRQAFEGIATAVRWQTKEELHEASDLHKLRGQERVRIDGFHTLCYELANLAESAYQFKSPITVEMVTVAQTKEQMRAYVSESISSATTEVLAVLSPPHLLGPLVWEAVVRKIQQGIVYKRISVCEEILQHGFKITKREVEKVGVNLYFVDPEKINQKFYVVDGKTVVFFNPSPRLGEFEFAGQVIRNQEIGSRYKAEFYRLCSDAIPARFVLEQLVDVRSNLIKRAKNLLDESTLQWFQRIVDYGVFTRLPQLTQEQKKIARKRALDAGLVKRYNSYYTADSRDDVVANLEIDFDAIRKSWQSQGRS